MKKFEAAETRARVHGAMEASSSALWLSALNVFEIVKTKNPRVRARLLETARALSETRFLLPMPLRLLQRVGQAIVDGDDGFRSGATGLEWMVHEPERLNDNHVAQASRILLESQQVWDNAHRLARRAIRPMLTSAGAVDPWGSIGVFLDQQWMKLQQLDTFIERLWTSFPMAGPPPFDALLQNEAWQLYFEGLGATVYERCIPNQPPKPAHVVDVLQLVYMAGARRRTLVTDDAGLLRVASAVLIGRHSNVSVLTTSEFLATST